MTKKFIIDNLDCANCAAKMERAISKINGVQNVVINFMTKKVIIDAEESAFEAIVSEANSKIKKIEKNVELKEC